MSLSKVTCFLMNQKGHQALAGLLQAGFADCIHNIVAGRDTGIRNDFFADITQLAESHQIPCYNRKDRFPVAPLCVAIGWRWLIDITQTRLIVFHDSPLPRYRGFAPLPNMLIRGEPQIGVTALWAGAEYDAGPIIAQRVIDIVYPITIQEAIDRISPVYSELAIEIFSAIRSGAVPAGTPQNENQATYSLWRDQDDYRIDWSSSADEIARFVDAVGYPYAGAMSLVNGQWAIIHKAQALPDLTIENRDIGKVIFVRDNCPVVVCGKGLLKVLDLRKRQTREPLLPLMRFRTRFQ